MRPIANSVAIALIALGCHGAGDADATSPASQPGGDANQSQPFSDAKAHFATTFPASWTTRTDPQNVLTADAPHDQGGQPELSIAVPSLGAHMPGLIPMGMVQNGYVKDAGTRLKDVKLVSQTGLQLAGAEARRIVLSGTASDGPHTIDAILCYRSKTDTLYIVTGETASNTTADEIHAVVDNVVSSWQWK